MKNISLSQEQLKELLGIISLAIKSGQLHNGDILMIAPILTQIMESIDPEEAKAEPIIEEKTN